MERNEAIPGVRSYATEQKGNRNSWMEKQEQEVKNGHRY